MDQSGVQVYVDLDGGWGEEILQTHLDHFKHTAPERFLHAAGINWSAWSEHGEDFGEWAAERLQVQKTWGAQLLKISKVLGTTVMDETGQRVLPGDSRLEPIWTAAGELNLPILIHVADPVAFFDPVDETNERWEELQNNPDWQFTSPPYPPFLDIVNSMSKVVEKFPQTTFIGAHVGWYSENLNWVSDFLDRCPNLYVDIGARISELGRQPYSSRRFFERYADRILFGTDAGPQHSFYRLYYRFLETEDEYFNYNPGDIPHQGRWHIYGLDLPDVILEKVYRSNALKVFGI
jgi:predicted TIM-barrel fold metal-dependent hydrolase